MREESEDLEPLSVIQSLSDLGQVISPLGTQLPPYKRRVGPGYDLSSSSDILVILWLKAKSLYSQHLQLKSTKSQISERKT